MKIVASTAQALGVKTLVTTHHGPAMDRNDDIRSQVLEVLRAHFNGEAVWGEDGRVFQV